MTIVADAAGKAAVKAASIVPMYVGTPKYPFGESEIDYNKPVEFIADGVCGFAWVNIKPGTNPFCKWLIKTGKARKDEYYGGVTIWVSDYNQSMQKKEAYAGAFAAELRAAGFERAYSASRMD